MLACPGARGRSIFRTVGYRCLSESEESVHPKETWVTFLFVSEKALDSQPDEHPGPITASISPDSSKSWPVATKLSRDVQPLSFHVYSSFLPSSSAGSELMS